MPHLYKYAVTSFWLLNTEVEFVTTCLLLSCHFTKIVNVQSHALSVDFFPCASSKGLVSCRQGAWEAALLSKQVCWYFYCCSHTCRAEYKSFWLLSDQSFLDSRFSQLLLWRVLASGTWCPVVGENFTVISNEKRARTYIFRLLPIGYFLLLLFDTEDGRILSLRIMNESLLIACHHMQEDDVLCLSFLSKRSTEEERYRAWRSPHLDTI